MMAIDFAIDDRSVDDDTHVVAVTGEIDLFTAPEFKQRMSAPIDDGAHAPRRRSHARPRSSTPRASAC